MHQILMLACIQFLRTWTSAKIDSLCFSVLFMWSFHPNAIEMICPYITKSIVRVYSYSFNASIIRLRAPHVFIDRKQPVNGPRTDKYDAHAGFLPIPVVPIPVHVCKGTVWHHCGSRTGPARVLQDMKNTKDSRAWSNHQCTAVPSRTGPVAWSDSKNSTDIKLLRALHPAFGAWNRTGGKKRTVPVVGCDWGINQRILQLMYRIALNQCWQISQKLGIPS